MRKSERRLHSATKHVPTIASPPAAGRLAMLLAAAAALASATACGGASAAGPRAAPVPAVVVTAAVAHRGPIDRQLSLPATVLPNDQAALYAKVAGYLKKIDVDKGDHVRAGQLLAEIQAPELEADLVRQKAELAVAEVAYRRISDAQQKAPDLVTPQSVDDAKGKRDVARASLERTQTLLGYTAIRAPFAGIVSKRTVDPGALIPAATSGGGSTPALLTLIDIRSVRVDIPVPENEVPHVLVGLPVLVQVDEIPGRTFSGHITRFAYAIEEASKTMLAEAEIANPDAALRPGMYARTSIAIEHKSDALLVPAVAVLAGKRQDSVLTVHEGKARRVLVKTGFRDSSSVEILDGLKPDELVIVGGPKLPADGQPVQVAEGR